MTAAIRFFTVFILSSFFINSAAASEPAGSLPSIPPFTKSDRILIFAPHPDDETIGPGGAIQRALKAGANVYIACFTNGDANQLAFIAYEKRLTFFKGEFLHMGEVRRKETISAMKFLGVDENNVFFLGYPDLGTAQIMLKYWGACKPYRSLATRVSNVPYQENLSPGAPYAGESILKDIKTILLKTKPTKIFVSHPADTNSDHQALYLFLQAALWDLDGKIKKPQVYPFLVHSYGWPKPRGFRPELALLPPENFSTSRALWQKLDLTEEEIRKKNEAISFYKSQIPYKPLFLHSFVRKNELFGDCRIIELNKEKLLQMEKEDMEPLGPSAFVSYEKSRNKLYIRVSFNRKITKGVTSFIYLIGYAKNRSFSNMPKIRLAVGRTRMLVYNKKSRIFVNDAKMRVENNSITIEFPLAALNSPDFIFARARIYTAGLAPDTAGWKILKVEKN